MRLSGQHCNRDQAGRCLKKRFESKAKARKKLRGPIIGRTGVKHVYWCDECGAWHLSSSRVRLAKTGGG